MRDEFALRYLVLKVLSRIPGVEQETRREVADSLRIVREKDQFLLTWTLDRMKHEAILPRERFTFYQRGDRRGSPPATGYEIQRRNFAQAADVVRALLGRPDLDIPHPESRYPRREEAAPVGPGWWWLAPVAASAAGGAAVAALGASVAACIVLERYTYRSLGAGGALAATSAWLGTPGGAAVAGLGLLGIALVSPRPQARALIATGGAIAVVSGAFAWMAHPAGAGTPGWPAWLAAAVCAATGLAAWTFGTHRELMPLTLPFVGVGVAADGFPLAALALAAGPAVVLGRRVVASRMNPHAPPSHPTPP
jgi:hypothetical protein